MISAESRAGVLTGLVPHIVDTHMHQWDPVTTPREASSIARLYRYAPAVIDRLFRLSAQADREFTLTPRNVLRPYLPGDYLADVAGVEDVAGVAVGTTVHVEAGWHSSDELGPAGETRWLDELPFGDGHAPRLGAIVGFADPRQPHVGDLLDAHIRATRRAPFRGIRSAASNHPDARVRGFGDDAHVLTSPEFLRGFAEVAERGLLFEAWVYAPQMHDVVVLAREYPETTIVLDHYATPAGLFGPMGSRTGHTAADRADIYARWLDGLEEVAACPNVVAKHSGLAFPVLGYGHRPSGNIGSRTTLTEMMGPLIEHTADVFGPDRQMFGSNFPIDKPNATVAMIVGSLLDVLTPRGDDLLRKVFHDNAVRIYGLSSD